MLKAVASAPVWECESLDLMAPISRLGVAYLLIDGKTLVFWDGDSTKRPDFATEAEKKEFARRRGYVFPGDAVEIIKGRGLPVGCIKTVKGFYRYTVPGSYGKVYTDYLTFTDGTKTATKNTRAVGVELFRDVPPSFTDKMPVLLIGGRI